MSVPNREICPVDLGADGNDAGTPIAHPRHDRRVEAGAGEQQRAVVERLRQVDVDVQPVPRLARVGGATRALAQHEGALLGGRHPLGRRDRECGGTLGQQIGDGGHPQVAPFEQILAGVGRSSHGADHRRALAPRQGRLELEQQDERVLEGSAGHPADLVAGEHRHDVVGHPLDRGAGTVRERRRCRSRRDGGRAPRSSPRSRRSPRCRPPAPRGRASCPRRATRTRPRRSHRRHGAWSRPHAPRIATTPCRSSRPGRHARCRGQAMPSSSAAASSAERRGLALEVAQERLGIHHSSAGNSARIARSGTYLQRGRNRAAYTYS